jgi:ribosome biogenesis protein SSF1/2
LTSTKRVLLINYNQSNNTCDIRHYSITTNQSNDSSKLSHLLSGNLDNINLDNFDFGNIDSDHNTEHDIQLTIDKKKTFKSLKTKEATVETRRVKLQEIGPRLSLSLVKINSGLFNQGAVLHHSYINKTSAEIKLQELRVKELAKLKESRRQEQLKNIERKEMEREQHKQVTSLGGLKGAKKRIPDVSDDEVVNKKVGKKKKVNKDFEK